MSARDRPASALEVTADVLVEKQMDAQYSVPNSVDHRPRPPR